MTTIGNDVIPGIQTTVDSASSVSLNLGSPTDVALVGPADETAQEYPGANEVEAITTPNDARKMFGAPADSMLTTAIFQAFAEGALPVYACAVEGTQVTGEDISGISSTSGTLQEAPLSEHAMDVSATVDSTDLTVNQVVDDPSMYTVESGEIYYNPIDGDFELAAAPSTSGTVDYVHHNTASYKAAFEAVAEQRGETIDFLVPLQENLDVTQEALNQVSMMVNFYELAVALCGLPPETTIQQDITENTFDDSRLQLIFPARNSDGESAMGAYGGRRSALGLQSSAMGKALSSQGRMYQRVSTQNEKDLVNNNIVPIRSSTGGARIVDDPTTVTSQNSQEAGMRQGFARLVMDRVINIVSESEKPFIGRMNKVETRNALETILETKLEELLKSDSIEEYNVTVREKSAMAAQVEVTADTTDPLRNIYNDILAGQVE